MHKLQCLNISKHFLKGCFLGTMKQLAAHSYWRDGFTDQLGVAFKDQLLTAVRADAHKFAQAAALVDGLVGAQLDGFEKKKAQIKSAMVAKQSKREKSRLIESADRRIVHFIFDTKQRGLESPFTRKFAKLMDGAEELAAFEQEETEKFDEYVEKIANEAEDAVNPVVYGKNPFYELELKNLHRLWTRPVHLETEVEKRPKLLSFNGKKHSEKSL